MSPPFDPRFSTDMKFSTVAVDLLCHLQIIGGQIVVEKLLLVYDVREILSQFSKLKILGRLKSGFSCYRTFSVISNVSELENLNFDCMRIS